MRPPQVVAHADWGVGPGKRQVAVAVLVPGGAARPRYHVGALGPEPVVTAWAGGSERTGNLLLALRSAAFPGDALAGFDFPVGLPRAYAAAAKVASFPEFLDGIGSPPWEEFGLVAQVESEISLHRPFYPAAPGGTRREHLYAGLGLPAAGLRRRCEGTDAETLFWTLGGKQVGKAAIDGWRMIAAARQQKPLVALWPFDGPVASLLRGQGQAAVVETYPREFYRQLRAAAGPQPRWSKRRLADRLALVPGLLGWAAALGVSWDRGVAARVMAGFPAGARGEDEFDAVVGLLGMIAVVTGRIGSGEPEDDPAISRVEGWILGRRAR